MTTPAVSAWHWQFLISYLKSGTNKGVFQSQIIFFYTSVTRVVLRSGELLQPTLQKIQQTAEELLSETHNNALNKTHETYLQEQRSSRDNPRRIWQWVVGRQVVGCRRRVAVHTHSGRSPCWKHTQAQTCGCQLNHRSWSDTHTLLPHTLHPTDIPHPGTSLKNTTNTFFYIGYGVY